MVDVSNSHCERVIHFSFSWSPLHASALRLAPLVVVAHYSMYNFFLVLLLLLSFFLFSRIRLFFVHFIIIVIIFYIYLFIFMFLCAVIYCFGELISDNGTNITNNVKNLWVCIRAHKNKNANFNSILNFIRAMTFFIEWAREIRCVESVVYIMYQMWQPSAIKKIREVYRSDDGLLSKYTRTRVVRVLVSFAQSISLYSLFHFFIFFFFFFLMCACRRANYIIYIRVYHMCMNGIV